MFKSSDQEKEEINQIKQLQKQQPNAMQSTQKIKKTSKSRARKKKPVFRITKRKTTVNKQIEDYINSKMCQLCKGQQNQEQILLCDRCDDSYHRYCLDKNVEISEKQWLCPVCVTQLQQTQKNIQQFVIPRIEKSTCSACEKSLKQPWIIVAKDKFNKQIAIQTDIFQNQTCMYCKNTFHQYCFSQRKNSLNCKTCQKSIRKQGPRSHFQFMDLLELSIEQIKAQESPYLTLTDLQHDEEAQRYRYFKFKAPCYISSSQFIIQYQASLYYAFKTKGLSFIDEQIYDKKDQHLMKLNDPKRDINGHIYRLHQKDQKTYEEFKINSQKGFVGPFEIKEDRVKRFYLVATDFIEPFTIVSEYVGQVITARDALKYEDNDSIFMLVRSSRSCDSLDIVPQKFGNISRFFSGINNNFKRSQRQYENIKSMRFNYKGRVRILLYTIKPIQAGQTLYFDYNGSAYNEYPTQHFVYQ